MIPPDNCQIKSLREMNMLFKAISKIILVNFKLEQLSNNYYGLFGLLYLQIENFNLIVKLIKNLARIKSLIIELQIFYSMIALGIL